MWLDELADDAVDPARKVPLHAQLSAVVRSRITDGSLPAGSMLPTEAELTEKFGISRSVVRQALLALTGEGLVLRGRGRGSVVAPPGEHHRLVQRMSGLSTQLDEVTTEVLSLSPERDALAESTLGVRDVVALHRLRSAAGSPIALIHTWLPSALALSPEELTNASLHSLLRRKHGISIVTGRRQVRAVAASPSQAESLRVAAGSPLLLLEGTSFDAAGLPVEMFRTWHRADRVVFDLDVVKGDTAESSTTTGSPQPHSGTTSNLGVADRARALARDLQALADDLGSHAPVVGPGD
ncbi:GntR family transcriptional regulator [Frigoribacterium sp. UYMn621]|jgi:GntR family transcriptional regulator|uniref:GntR family transcriptional regulator n=1 Tax=Frigoribacterium sp. UYMn621 TaxID=3156343 RepID=UPI003393C809